MRTVTFILATLLVSGCSESELQQAERRYEFLKANGADSDELCGEAQKVRAAAADADDTASYQRWTMVGSADCAEAQVERLRLGA